LKIDIVLVFPGLKAGFYIEEKVIPPSSPKFPYLHLFINIYTQSEVSAILYT